MEERKTWLQYMIKISEPIIRNAANDNLKNVFPLSRKERSRGVAYLEAIGRTLYGIAPWLELEKVVDEEEKKIQTEFRELAKQAVINATTPTANDYCVWNADTSNPSPDQPVVDAGYFASALIKAPNTLWKPLTKEQKENVINSIKLSLMMKPVKSNWLLFTAEAEAFLYMATGYCDTMKIEYAVGQHIDWYVGDGVYGDGEYFKWDYYNSYVIHPMIEEVFSVCKKTLERYEKQYKNVIYPAIKRYCEAQERMIAPDGTYPPIGRSITYKMAAFQTLSYAAWKHLLPDTLPSSQVRRALSKVIKKGMESNETFEENGFLNIGLYGKQTTLANSYTNRGSQYLCLAVFAPLGLSENDIFWSKPTQLTTWEKIWSGQDMEPDISAEI